MELETLVNEFASFGLGEQLYRELLQTVRKVVLGHRYPPSYSPTGRWDEDAFTAVTHDWAIKKLLQYHHLEHLLLSNQTLQGFRKGLELSFVHFLIGQKKRTALDNLFRRASAILESDSRFRCFIESTKKATRFWGLASWTRPQPYQGTDDLLITVGLRVEGFRIIRYRDSAGKLSPVVSDHDLGEVLFALLETVGRLLNLTQLVTIFRYRFDLIEVREVSIEEPVVADGEGHTLSLGETIHAGPTTEDAVVVKELALSLLRQMRPRQREVLLEYAKADATLVTVADQLGCSKSTVDNELRGALELIRSQTETVEEARVTYSRVLEMLSSG